MADAQLNLTRRALLGAACMPVLARHSGPDPESTLVLAVVGQGRWTPDQVRGDEERWQDALAQFRAAEAALAALAHVEDDDLYDRHLGRFNAATKRLLRTAAPDLAALAAKLDLLVSQQAWELTGGELCIAALQRDARHFAAAAR
jgi:hypothetical protein